MTKVYDTAYFIERATKIHGNKYDYSKSIYSGSKNKVEVICNIHGSFLMAASNHVNLKRGCPKCTRSKSRRRSQSEFIEIVSKLHGGKYDYSRVVYKGSAKSIEVICPEHGLFVIEANSHAQGRGCRKCSGCHPSNTQEFIRKARATHGNRYSYEKSKYKNCRTKLYITCKYHGDFLQNPNRHVSGSGCPKCGKISTCWTRTGFSRVCKRNGGYGYLYIIRCFDEHESFYKVGITSRSLSTRFRSKYILPYDYQEVYVIKENAMYVYNLERKLHKILGLVRYEPNKLFDGHTECFTTIKPIEKLLKELSTTEQLQLLA